MDARRTRIRPIVSTVLAAAAGTFLGSGCASNGPGYDTGGSASAGPAVSQFDDPNPQATTAKDWFSGDDNSKDRRDDEPLVPRTARLAAEGRGDLSYKATRDGFAYVIDNRDKRMVWEGPIDKDETLTVAPYRNVIEINGKRVKRVRNLDNKHIHRIYFERDSDRGRDHRDRERRDR
jgi:hypothetical protein